MTRLSSLTSLLHFGISSVRKTYEKIYCQNNGTQNHPDSFLDRTPPWKEIFTPHREVPKAIDWLLGKKKIIFQSQARNPSSPSQKTFDLFMDRIKFNPAIMEELGEDWKEEQNYTQFSHAIIETLDEENIQEFFPGDNQSLLREKLQEDKKALQKVLKENLSDSGLSAIERTEKIQMFFQNNEKFMEKIPFLTLYNKNLTEIPKEIGLCKNLLGINLQKNFLTNLPNEIRNLKGLKQLFLDNNCFKEFPKEVLSLQKLVCLSLANNDIEDIPEGLKALSHLEKLYLHNNRLTKTPNLPPSLYQKNSIFTLLDNPIPFSPISFPGSGIGKWTYRLWLCNATITSAIAMVALGIIRSKSNLSSF